MGNLGDTLAPALIFRVLLPGFVGAVGLFPLLHGIRPLVALGEVYPGGDTVLFTVLVVVLGLLAYAATLPIHHILHGEVLSTLTRVFRRLNEWRVNKAATKLGDLYGTKTYEELSTADKAAVRKLNVYLADFPIRDSGKGGTEWAVLSSTRLGSIIDTYQAYPETRYGVQGENFWTHWAYLVPESARRELDASGALAQGLVVSAAAAIIGLAGVMIVAVGRLVGLAAPMVPAPIDDSQLFGLGFVMVAAVILFNVFAREAHRDHGRRLRSAFDVHAHRFEQWLLEHKAPFSEAVQKRADELGLYLHYLEGAGSDGAD